MLLEALRQLTATGTAGFEGVIQRLLNHLTGYNFYLAQAGTQLGRDMSSNRVNATVLAVECKRYGENTELDKSELLGKLSEAATAIPRLDVWVLVASREVPDQLYTALKTLGDRLNIDVEIIATGDGSPSTLEVLCAHGAEVILEHLKVLRNPNVEAIASQMESIASQPDFQRMRNHLKAVFTRTSGYDATRRRLSEWLLAQFGSDVNSRAHLGQVVDVDARQRTGRLVPRKAALTEFDRWLNAWPTERRPLVVLGEEGDGKTWSVAEWTCTNLLRDPGFPAVLWLPSRDATTQDIDALIGNALVSRLGASQDRWLTRLRRWSSLDSAAPPALIVVCDGMNERHETQWWRPVLESLSAEPWRNVVAPILTSRISSWTGLKRLPHLRCREWTIAPFDDDELAEALRQAGIDRQELSETLLTLLRKPRYFDLTVQHRQAMSQSGDVTVARLIYEDWSDRYIRHAELADADAFHDVIKRLARRYAEGQQTFERAEILNHVDGVDDRRAIARELETGGIMVADGKHWRVEPNRLTLGLGLLLADSLSAAPAGNLLEILEAQLEPQPDIDLKAAILEQAALHALETPGFSTELRTLLLCAWLTHRNHRDDDARTVGAYFPLDPAAYLAAAEFIWRTDTDDARAEQLLKATYGRWAAVDRFVPQFAAAFQRWLGFVHIDGSPVATTPEDRKRRRDSLSAVLGKTLEQGPFEYAGINFTAITDDDLLRLGRLALAIISEDDRRPYAKALLTAYVADSLMQFPDRLDLCEWIIRTSTDDLWSLLEAEIHRLIDLGSNTALKAVYRLLDSFGTEAANALRAALPSDELFPRPQWHKDYERDPCSSGFSWPMDACERCASREDIPAYFMAQQISRCAPNPQFRIPPTTARRTVAELGLVDVSKLWSGPGQTEHEIRFDTLELVTARSDPERLGDTIRAVAADCAHRTDLALRQRTHELIHYRLALRASELSVMWTVWQAIAHQPTDSLTKEQERAEWGLVELLLGELSADEQLQFLLQRSRNARVLVRYRPYFKPLPWSQIALRLESASDSSEVSRVLFFATGHPEMLDESASPALVGCVVSSDRHVRGAALELIYRADVASAAAEIVKTSWHYQGDDDSWFQDRWGGMVLARWGQSLPYSELRVRVGPAQLGTAVFVRGSKSDEVAAYADDINRVWQRIGDIASQTSNSPLVEVRANVGPVGAEVERPGLASSTFSRSIRFLVRQATWGGVVSDHPPANFLKPISDAELEELQEALRNELSKQRQAGNVWFAERFNTAALVNVIGARPDLVNTWLAENAEVNKRLWLARSFYEALCEVLLTHDPARGAAVYKRLQQPGAVRFVERGTGIPLLDYALFAATDTEHVRALWNARLENGRNDHDLLAITILASAKASRQWLEDRISSDLNAGRPLPKIRAIMLLGFMQSDPATVYVPAHGADVIEWQKQQRDVAVRNWHRNHWAQEWFERSLNESSNDRALASFRLFLSCVDNRFWSWRDSALDAAPESRKRFVETSENQTENAIQKNEQDLKKRFLGMDVEEGQVWPWL